MDALLIPFAETYRAGLLSVWESSVKATHNFLKPEDFLVYKQMLQEFDFQLLEVFCLQYQSKIIGFIAIHEKKIEMLFLDPDFIGQGLGKKLVLWAISEHEVTKVDVNEQNRKAVIFYEKMGFEVAERTDHDDMGKPYPILKMKLKNIKD